MLVPQSMAYALLAGLPPIYGLYAATVPTIVYALFGTSRHMTVGPPALMALLTFTTVSSVAEPGTDEYIGYALLLALMVGVLQLALGMLKMGFLTNFISQPVLSGFIYASVVIIAVSQADELLGIQVSGGHSTPVTVLEIFQKLGELNWITLAIGVTCVAVIVLIGRFAPRLPGALVAVAAATFAVYLLSLDGRGVDVVGDVPRGLPGFSIPPLDFEVMQTLFTAALIVAFVGFIESISVAQAIATQAKYRVDSNQELRALGLANVGASFFSGFPVAGSFSRTAVQYQSGGRTQMASIMTALMVLATMLLLTPLFYYLPDAALAAIILVAVYKLLDFEEARRIVKVRKADGLALLITFVVTVAVGVEQGVISGAVFALLAYLRRTAYPEIVELGYVEQEDSFLGQNSYPEGHTFPKILIVRFDARLYFANISFLEDWLHEAVADRPDLELLVLDFRGVNGVDVTAIEGLENLIEDYNARGIDFLITHAKPRVRERLKNANWDKRLPHVIEHQTTREALRDAGFLERRVEHDTK